MQNITLIKILVMLIVFYQVAFCQDENKVLAIIGSDEITVGEFKDRFEFMPHLNYSDSNIDSIKMEFLYSLIAEKLWALEALQLRIDTFETIKHSLHSLQNLFVKDELYKQEVESKIVITNDEISKGLSNINRIISVSIITSPDSIEIWNLFDAFQSGLRFDSMLVVMGMPEKRFEIKYGSLEDEAVEDMLYSLNLNEIAKPVKSKDHWFIFKLVGDHKDTSIDLSNDHSKNIVLKKLKDRKAQKLGRNFLDNLLGGESITADRKLFDVFTEKLIEVLKRRSEKSESDSLVNIQLLESDILKLLKLISKTELIDPFIKMEIYPATLEDFMFYLIYQKVYFNSLSINKVRLVLNRAVKQFIEDETLAREGYKRGLENLTSVKNDLKIWRNYYLAEVLMNSYSDSIIITDNEIEPYTQQENNLSDTGFQLNIVEILTDEIDDIEKIFSELNTGKDFKELASVYNKREWTKQSNGEWGLFNASSAGEIGRRASELEVGEIYGPLKVPGGYSIFKLIEKKKNVLGKNNFTDKEEIKFARIKIALGKMDKLINDKTVSLAKKFSVNVNKQLLSSIQTSELNTFTYRLIGFGGKIAAFPITVPMYEWYKQYEQKKEIP